MKAKMFLALLALVPAAASAQNLPCRTYGGEFSEQALAMAVAPGGGNVLAGWTTSFPTHNPADTNLLVVHVDSFGNIVRAIASPWQSADVIHSIARTGDNGYILCGWTRSFGVGIPNANILVVRLDAALNPVWTRVYGGDFDDYGYSIIQSPQGYFYLTGSTASYGPAPHPNIIVMKLSPSGGPVWTRVFNRSTYAPGGHAGADEGFSIAWVSGSPAIQLAVCGRYHAVSGGSFDAFLLQLDSLGNHIGAATLNGPNDEEARSVIFDGGTIALAGWTASFAMPGGASPEPNIFLWQRPSGMGPGWRRLFGWSNGPEYLMGDKALIPTPASYDIAGWTGSRGPGTPGQPNFLMIRTNMGGSVLHARVHPSIPGDNTEQAYAVTYDANRGYAVAGFTNSFGLGGDDFHYVTLDQLGNRPVCVIDVAPMEDEFLTQTDSFDVITEVPFTEEPPAPVDVSVWFTDVCVIPRPDVRPHRIITPTGTIDSLQGVVPVCSLHNSGNVTVSYDATFKVSGFLTRTVTVNNHAPGTYVEATFGPAYADWPRGTQTTRCWTSLAGDQNPADDTIGGSFNVRVRNVRPVRFAHPISPWDSGYVATPACSVYNSGSEAATYWTHLRIGGFYRDSAQVSAHPAGTAGYVTFSPFADWPRGLHAVGCSTALAGDIIPADDTLGSSLSIWVRDVACSHLLGIPLTVDSGTTVTPACSLDNDGTNTAFNYQVRLTIGGIYDDTVTIAAHPPGTRIGATFDPFTPHQIGGPYPVACSTRLTGDLVDGNNRQTTTVVVRRPGGYDVGTTHIIEPVGQLDSGSVTVPACSVRNYGVFPVSYRVRMRIGAGYNDTARIDNHAPGTAAYVTFPAWTASPPGIIAVTCSTELDIDDTPADDKVTGTVQVRRIGPDVALTRIISPSGTLAAGILIVPACSVYNTGNQTVSYSLRMTIDTGYAAVASVANHAPGTALRVNLPPWSAHPNGYLDITAWSELAGDVNPANDTARGTVRVVPTGYNPWVEMAPMPADVSGRAAGHGAWLVFDAGSGFFYAAKGNKTQDFYHYNPLLNSWQLQNPIPRDAADRAPAKGSAGAADGNGIVYATRGNNTCDFLRYHAQGDSWELLDSVPLGPRHTRVRSGTGLAWVSQGGDEYVYLLKGYRNEFYRYHVALDTWQQLEDAPAGRNRRYDVGSWLVHDGGSYLYAFKSRYHELWRFNLATLRWDTAAHLAQLPRTNRYGRYRKARDGGAAALYAGRIYAFKGANTQDFYAYHVASDSWDELDTIPAWGSSGRRKRIKGGAAIASRNDGTIYALKGNKTRELWRYVTGSLFAPDRPGRDGAMAAGGELTPGLLLSIAPNPLAGGRATVHYSLPGGGAAILAVHDVAGRLALSRPLGHPATGSLDLDLRALPAGVYLVRLSGDGFSASRKLVIER